MALLFFFFQACQTPVCRVLMKTATSFVLGFFWLRHPFRMFKLSGHPRLIELKNPSKKKIQDLHPDLDRSKTESLVP